MLPTCTLNKFCCDRRALEDATCLGRFLPLGQVTPAAALIGDLSSRVSAQICAWSTPLPAEVQALEAAKGSQVPKAIMALHAQMMWRLNFLVFFCCVTLNNDYMLYYICPMHTLFTLMVFAVCAIGHKYNDRNLVVYFKFAG
jgi:hypothetical protein